MVSEMLKWPGRVRVSLQSPGMCRMMERQCERIRRNIRNPRTRWTTCPVALSIAGPGSRSGMTAGSTLLPEYVRIPMNQKRSLSSRINRNLPAVAWQSWMNWPTGADFVLGHNLIDFDLPHLRRLQSPTCRLLQLPSGGHAPTQPPGLSPQPLSLSGEALPGRVAATGPAE